MLKARFEREDFYNSGQNYPHETEGQSNKTLKPLSLEAMSEHCSRVTDGVHTDEQKNTKE